VTDGKRIRLHNLCACQFYGKTIRNIIFDPGMDKGKMLETGRRRYYL